MTERTSYYHKPKRNLESLAKGFEKISLEPVDGLDNLNYHFSQDHLQWDRLISQYQQIKSDIDIARKIKGKNVKKFCSEELASLFSEMHLRNYLEINNQRQDEIIPSGATTQNYLFERSIDGRLHVYNKSRTKEYCEYDALGYMNDTPILFEVKMCNYVRNGINEKIEIAMDKSHLEHVFKPLSELFDTNQFGYSLIIPPEEIRHDSISQRRFINSGGTITPFCMKNITYRTEVENIRHKCKI